MIFNSFIEKYKIKNQATLNKNIQQVVCSFSLKNVGIHLRDGPCQFDIGIVNSHPTKRTHFLAYITGNYFDSYVCSLIKHSKVTQTKRSKKGSNTKIDNNSHCEHEHKRAQKIPKRCKRSQMTKKNNVISSTNENKKIYKLDPYMRILSLTTNN